MERERKRREAADREREKEMFGEELDLTAEDKKKVEMLERVTEKYYQKRLLPKEYLSLSKACEALYLFHCSRLGND